MTYLITKLISTQMMLRSFVLCLVCSCVTLVQAQDANNTEEKANRNQDLWRDIDASRPAFQEIATPRAFPKLTFPDQLSSSVKTQVIGMGSKAVPEAKWQWPSANQEAAKESPRSTAHVGIKFPVKNQVRMSAPRPNPNENVDWSSSNLTHVVKTSAQVVAQRASQLGNTNSPKKTSAESVAIEASVQSAESSVAESSLAESSVADPQKTISPSASPLQERLSQKKRLSLGSVLATRLRITETRRVEPRSECNDSAQPRVQRQVPNAASQVVPATSHVPEAIGPTRKAIVFSVPPTSSLRKQAKTSEQGSAEPTIVSRPTPAARPVRALEVSTLSSQESGISLPSFRKEDEKLLNAADMMGDLQDPVALFERLDLKSEFLSSSQIIESGPRQDESSVTWFASEYTWMSPAFHHKPLYFEQPNLERYGIGRSRLVQPFASGFHFFASIALIPYKSFTHHPAEKVYTLGQNRPGDCVPVQRRVWLGQSTFGEARWFWADNSGYR